MNNINFSFLGKINENELNVENPTVYRSGSLITSLSYAGDMSLIKASTTFSEKQKNALVKIEGKVSLGTTGGELKNAHVYSKNAIHLDGIDRICYIQPDEENLIVREYSGNRGAKYSALFRLLVEELKNRGFDYTDNKILIEEINIPKFVSAINKVIKLREEEAYELSPIAESDSIFIDKKRYYYNKVYWTKKSINQNQIISNNDIQITIDSALKLLINYTKNCNDTNGLDNLSGKLVKLNNIILKRIQTLNEIEDLNLSL